MRTIFAAVLFAGIAAGQTFTLGSASDPCVGGTTWSLPGAPIPALRFGSAFSCTFATAPGTYIVELDCVEPAAFVPASDPNGRSFNVVLGDVWGTQVYGQMSNVDLFTMGAFSPAVVIARSFLVFSGDGRIKVSLSTNKRSAVISRVIITPLGLAPLLGSAGTSGVATRQPGPSGLDLITFVLPDGHKRYEIGVPVLEGWLSSRWANPVPIADIPLPITGK